MGHILTLNAKTIPYLASGNVLAGVSGGRDSVALLVLLSRLEGCFPIACHVHHGIRSETADRDAEFVEKLAKKLNIPFKMEKVNVPLLAKKRKKSIEETARETRQSCFIKWRAMGLGDVVALAHHRDDQAETVLINLCRGGRGIRGMRPVSSLDGGVTVLRPLIDISREDITGFLEGEGIDWVEDETNEQNIYTRNAVRHEIMPRLNRIMQRDVSVAISRSARIAEEAEQALRQSIGMLDVVDPQGRLFLPKVGQMPEELKKAVVFQYLRDNELPDISEDCVLRILSILPTDAPSRVSLPGGWIASRKEHRLRLLPPTGEK